MLRRTGIEAGPLNLTKGAGAVAAIGTFVAGGSAGRGNHERARMLERR